MKLATICVQGAYRPKNGEPRVVPIVQSTTYKYDSSVEMGDLFDLKKSGYFYSRLQTPPATRCGQDRYAGRGRGRYAHRQRPGGQLLRHL